MGSSVRPNNRSGPAHLNAKATISAFLDAPGGLRWEPYAAAALVMLRFGFETTNRKEGLRRLGLAIRTAASSCLKALRFMVAKLPLW